jgi:hypothetical protein
MSENIHIYCSRDDNARVEWFSSILQSRIRPDNHLPIHIIYGDVTLPPYEHSRAINIKISKSSRQLNEIEKIFDRFSKNDWLEYNSGLFHVNVDLVVFTLWNLNREEENLQKDDPGCWDKKGRFKLEKTLAYKKGLWRKPVVDILLKQLIEKIQLHYNISLLNECPWGLNKSYGVWLTHDVDNLIGRYVIPVKLMVWSFLAIWNVLKGNIKLCRRWLLKVFSTLIDDRDTRYESLFKIIQLENVYHVNSTFFFMSLRKGISIKERLRYPINHKKTLSALNSISASGNYIGLHPGRYKPYDIANLTMQKTDLESVLNKKVEMVRNHHLLARYPDSWFLHETAGFRLCSNMGWGPDNGFRAGTCWPYHPFDLEHGRPLNLVEVPLIYMDNTMDCEEAIMKDMEYLIREVSEVHGLLTANFHSHIFENTDGLAKGNAFKYLVRMCKSFGVTKPATCGCIDR